jgi:hypothetical protein
MQLIIELDEIPASVLNLTPEEWAPIIAHIDELITLGSKFSLSPAMSAPADVYSAATAPPLYTFDPQKYVDQIEELENEITELEKQNKLFAAELNTKNIEYAFNRELITKLKSGEEIHVNAYARLNESLLTTLHRERELIIESQKSTTANNINQVIELLKPITKHFSGTNVEKGNSGESSISRLLSEKYVDAIIDDVSGDASSGDLIISWRKIKCVIEVKNKTKLTKPDMTKFSNDIIALSDVNRINCAIMVSLQDDAFPGRTRDCFQHDYINGVPVIYLFAPPPSTQIYFALNYLSEFINNQNEKNVEELEQQFNNYYNIVDKQCKYYQKVERIKQKELKEVKLLLTYYTNVRNEIEPLYCKLNLIENDESSNDEIQPQVVSDPFANKDDEFSDEAKMTLLVDTYVDFVKNGKDHTNITVELLSATAGIDQRFIKQLKIKTIAEEVQTVLLKQYVNTKEQAQKIVDFHVKRNRYPNQKESIEMGIFTEYIARVLSRGIKSRTCTIKNVSNVIGNYCVDYLAELNKNSVSEFQHDVGNFENLQQEHENAKSDTSSSDE